MSRAPIDLPFTAEEALQVLRWGALHDSPFSHQQIADWCDRFWCQYLDVDAPPDLERLLPILTAVEIQWDLFLANSYSSDELRTGSFEHVRMPAEWFEQWLRDASGGSQVVKGLDPPQPEARGSSVFKLGQAGQGRSQPKE